MQQEMDMEGSMDDGAYDGHMDDDEEGQYHHMDMDGDDDHDDNMDDDESFGFDQNPEYSHLPPLDKMRKVRRDIIKTINDVREKFKHPGIYGDILLNRVANEYAQFLLSEDENEEAMKQICEQHGILGQPKAIVGIAYLEEEENPDKTKHEEFMDAHGLLLELQDELKLLTDEKLTHIGVGFAYDQRMVKVVELLLVKDIMVSHLSQSEDLGV